jgi:hypothetical protein
MTASRPLQPLAGPAVRAPCHCDRRPTSSECRFRCIAPPGFPVTVDNAPAAVTVETQLDLSRNVIRRKKRDLNLFAIHERIELRSCFRQLRRAGQPAVCRTISFNRTRNPGHLADPTLCRTLPLLPGELPVDHGANQCRANSERGSEMRTSSATPFRDLSSPRRPNNLLVKDRSSAPATVNRPPSTSFQAGITPGCA